ncbi:MAG: flagellar hook-length control protein FliK, partial [Lachnospiraceae bacterium]|nr:flagellar hook-length control protein FliK [Lachnospiraceae bacterium]
TPYTQQGINPTEIARQMISGVRTVVTESLRTMELQLNPENLGKMIIHVSEQDGQLTARINIQNENVRTAMEEQMAIVKNNLEAQGLKIESVTVTADAHEFERNLEEGNAARNDMNSPEGREANADTSEGNDGRRQGVRSLNMNELEGGNITDLNEDELLAARIMRENGSTLNINA